MAFKNITWYQISNKLSPNRAKYTLFSTKTFQATKVCQIEQN